MIIYNAFQESKLFRIKIIDEGSLKDRRIVHLLGLLLLYIKGFSMVRRTIDLLLVSHSLSLFVCHNLVIKAFLLGHRIIKTVFANIVIVLIVSNVFRVNYSGAIIWVDRHMVITLIKLVCLLGSFTRRVIRVTFHLINLDILYILYVSEDKTFKNLSIKLVEGWTAWYLIRKIVRIFIYLRWLRDV